MLAATHGICRCGEGTGPGNPPRRPRSGPYQSDRSRNSPAAGPVAECRHHCRRPSYLTGHRLRHHSHGGPQHRPCCGAVTGASCRSSQSHWWPGTFSRRNGSRQNQNFGPAKVQDTPVLGKKDMHCRTGSIEHSVVWQRSFPLPRPCHRWRIDQSQNGIQAGKPRWSGPLQDQPCR